MYANDFSKDYVRFLLFSLIFCIFRTFNILITFYYQAKIINITLLMLSRVLPPVVKEQLLAKYWEITAIITSWLAARSSHWTVIYPA
jgi:hypothetical protein